MQSPFYLIAEDVKICAIGYGMRRGTSGFMMDATDRLKGQISFSSRQNSVMSQISEMESDDMDGSSSPKDGGGGGRSYIPGFPVGSWDDSSPFNNNSLSDLKRGRDGEEKMVTALSPLELPQVLTAPLHLLHSIHKLR